MPLNSIQIESWRSDKSLLD